MLPGMPCFFRLVYLNDGIIELKSKMHHRLAVLVPDNRKLYGNSLLCRVPNLHSLFRSALIDRLRIWFHHCIHLHGRDDYLPSRSRPHFPRLRAHIHNHRAEELRHHILTGGKLHGYDLHVRLPDMKRAGIGKGMYPYPAGRLILFNLVNQSRNILVILALRPR